MLHIDIGLSALRAQQQAMATLSNNIANASNDAYTRQRVQFASRPDLNLSNQWQGTGVEITAVQRLLDKGVQTALLDQRSQSGLAQVQLDYAQRIEGLFLPGAGALTNSVNAFFNAARELAARPDETVIREQFIGAATKLTEGINQTLTALRSLQGELGERLTDTVAQTNGLAAELVAINRNIVSSQQQGTSSNAFLDQRDQILSQLAEFVDLDTAAVLRGSTAFSAAGGSLFFGHEASTLTVGGTAAGQTTVTSALGAVAPRSGRLGGLLSAQDGLAQNVAAFQDWATQLIVAVDQIQATGLGTAGARSTLTGTRGVTDAELPLAQAGLQLPIASGTLTVTTTNQQSGQRFVHQLAVDPQVDTLRDLASRLSAIPNVSATVDESSGRLKLSAASGFSFDFANRLPTRPDLVGWSGTSQPVLSGSYLGASNRRLVGEVVTVGTVGVDPDVTVRLRDADTGAEVGLLHLGTGTAVNQPQEVIDGVEIAFSGGQLVAGESFTFPVVADSDSTGLLSALGLGRLFTGFPGQDLGINTAIRSDSRLLATGRNGGIADGTGVARLDGLATFASKELGNFVTRTGLNVVGWQARSDANQVQEDELVARRNSLSGVDPNEEVLQLLEFQRSFQAASRLIVSIDQTLDELFSIIR